MSSITFLVGLFAIGLAGFATQRGNICTVVAMEQVVNERRSTRLVSMLEATLWVSAGLLALASAGRLSFVPHGYRAAALTALGGALFGAGAIINGACAFGSVARLGSGDLAYVATPVGFLAGISGLHHGYSPASTSATAPLLSLHAPVAILVALVLVSSASIRLWRRGRKQIEQEHARWPSYVASAVIGLSFLTATVSFDRWTYMDFPGDLTQHGGRQTLLGLLLLAVLLAGAVLGGYVGRELALIRPTVAGVARCLAGGAVMGVAAGLIPGGNAALVLAEMPLLWPFAWLAFASLCAAVLVAVLMKHSFLRLPA